MIEPLLDALRARVAILAATLLLGGCVTTTAQNAQRAYGPYWGYGVTAPAASGLRLIWVTPSQTVCESVRRLDESRAPSHGVWRVLRELGGGDGTTMEFDDRCRVVELVAGTAAMAVSYAPQQMTVTNERVGYLIAPSRETCARLGYVVPPCFPVTVRGGVALGR